MSESTATYTLTIPGLTATYNQLHAAQHWARRHKLKQRDRQLVGIAARLAGIPLAAEKRRVSLTVVLPKGMRRPDPDCWFKSLLDALVCSGCLADDGPKWCELGPVTYERGERAEMRVTLEEMEP